MLDTDICIYTIKHKPAEVREAFNLHSAQLCISTVTLMELIYGAEKSAFPQHSLSIIEGFAARLEVLDYDHAAAAHSGQIRAELDNLGNAIGLFDQMIVGHARSRGLILVSNNSDEFGRVPGLRLENWVGQK